MGICNLCKRYKPNIVLMAKDGSKRGRPLKSDYEKLSQIIEFQLSQKDMDCFNDEFAKSGETYRKQFFMKAIRNYGNVRSIIQDREANNLAIQKVMGDFGHVSSNVNQVAHAVNILASNATSEELLQKMEEMIEHLKKVEKQIEKLNQISIQIQGL